MSSWSSLASRSGFASLCHPVSRLRRSAADWSNTILRAVGHDAQRGLDELDAGAHRLPYEAVRVTPCVPHHERPDVEREG